MKYYTKQIIVPFFLCLFFIAGTANAKKEPLVRNNIISLGLLNGTLGLQYEYQFDYKSIVHGPKVAIGRDFWMIFGEPDFDRGSIMYQVGVGGWHYSNCTTTRGPVFTETRCGGRAHRAYLSLYIQGGMQYSTQGEGSTPVLGAGLLANAFQSNLMVGVDFNTTPVDGYNMDGASFYFGYAF